LYRQQQVRNISISVTFNSAKFDHHVIQLKLMQIYFFILFKPECGNLISQLEFYIQSFRNWRLVTINNVTIKKLGKFGQFLPLSNLT
jgi:hypothetical protein